MCPDIGTGPKIVRFNLLKYAWDIDFSGVASVFWAPELLRLSFLLFVRFYTDFSFVCLFLSLIQVVFRCSPVARGSPSLQLLVLSISSCVRLH